MKYKNLLLVLLFVFFVFVGILLFFCKDIFVCKFYKSDIDWKFIWQDEFDKDGVFDFEKWVFFFWYFFCWDNNFVIFVKDGKFVLCVLFNNDLNDMICYMVGCVEILGKKDFLYGCFEVCVKLGSVKGFWFVIWLKLIDLIIYGVWFKCGEIDIMEQLNKDIFVYYIMYMEYIKVLGYKIDLDYYIIVFYNLYEFNVFGMEWILDKIDMFINDFLIFSYFCI